MELKRSGRLSCRHISTGIKRLCDDTKDDPGQHLRDVLSEPAERAPGYTRSRVSSIEKARP